MARGSIAKPQRPRSTPNSRPLRINRPGRVIAHSTKSPPLHQRILNSLKDFYNYLIPTPKPPPPLPQNPSPPAPLSPTTTPNPNSKKEKPSTAGQTSTKPPGGAEYLGNLHALVQRRKREYEDVLNGIDSTAYLGPIRKHEERRWGKLKKPPSKMPLHPWEARLGEEEEETRDRMLMERGYDPELRMTSPSSTPRLRINKRRSREMFGGLEGERSG